MRRLASLVALALVSGCVFFDDTDGPTCGAQPDSAPVLNLVDPSTLACTAFTVANCDPACGPCPALASPLPTWGACDSACRALDEGACRTSPGCRIAFDPTLDALGFLGCYPTDKDVAASVPCDGLDAWECSRHDDCEGAYVMDTTKTPVARLFTACVPEPVPSS
jgi:hypothetical protein